MNKSVKKARVGRPAVYDRPRTSIAARLQAPLHEKIKSDAEAAGRSISEEIERRLERSFEFENQLVDLVRPRAGLGIGPGEQLQALVESSGRPMLDVCLERIRQSFYFENQLHRLQGLLGRKEKLIDEALPRLRAAEHELKLLKASHADVPSPGITEAIENAVARGIARALK